MNLPLAAKATRVIIAGKIRFVNLAENPPKRQPERLAAVVNRDGTEALSCRANQPAFSSPHGTEVTLSAVGDCRATMHLSYNGIIAICVQMSTYCSRRAHFSLRTSAVSASIDYTNFADLG